MWKKGWKVVYFPSAKVVHYVGASSSTRVFRSIVDFHKSVYKLFYKYSEGWMRALSPLVAVALASRLILAIIMNKVGRLYKK